MCIFFWILISVAKRTFIQDCHGTFRHAMVWGSRVLSPFLHVYFQILSCILMRWLNSVKVVYVGNLIVGELPKILNCKPVHKHNWITSSGKEKSDNETKTSLSWQTSRQEVDWEAKTTEVPRRYESDGNNRCVAWWRFARTGALPSRLSRGYPSCSADSFCQEMKCLLLWKDNELVCCVLCGFFTISLHPVVILFCCG